MSVLVEQNPGRECEDDHQRRIDQRRRTNVRFQVAYLNDPVRDEGQRKAAQDTNHPGREIGTKNIDRRRMMTGNTHRNQTKNDDCEAEGGKLQNCSTRSHLSNGLKARTEPCNGLMAEGRSGRADGRARSPVLNASSVAVVKMAACVS